MRAKEEPTTIVGHEAKECESISQPAITSKGELRGREKRKFYKMGRQREKWAVNRAE
jgi:hypothetical protein